MKKERIIEIQPVKIESATICIEGDGDLVLNKMNARTIRELTRARESKRTTKEIPQQLGGHHYRHALAERLSGRGHLPRHERRGFA